MKIRSSSLVNTASQWKPLVAIRTGYVTLLPLVLLQGIAIAGAAALGLLFGQDQWVATRDLLYYFHSFVLSLLPALSVCAIAYHAANLYGSNRPYSIVLALFVYLLLVLTLRKDAGHRINDITLIGNLYSLVVSPAVPWALSRLERVALLQLFRSPHQNAYVRRFLNYLLPTLIIVVAAVAVDSGIRSMDWMAAIHAARPDADWANHYPYLAAYVVALNGLWTLGIHGTVALGPWAADLTQNGIENASAVLAGHAAPNLFPGPAMSAFVYLGGSGTGLALALAIFISARSRTKRLVCASAMPVLCFNVNELLLYGLPVIFNRYLVLPFILAPLACMSVAYAAILAGLVPVPLDSPGWTTPPLLGAWLSTRGSWAAVALSLFNLLMATAIYIPFIRRWESAQDAVGSRVLEFKDRFRFDAARPATHVEVDSLVETAEADKDELCEALDLLRGGTLCSYYQPVARARDGRIVAVESLLRLHHPAHGIMPPKFLGALKRANLIGDIDAWMIDNIIVEWSAWDMDRVPLPDIHINVTPSSLLVPSLVERLIDASRLLPIVVEIVEDELPEKLEQTLSSIALLQRNRIRLAIDDFGIGHSSLSRLTELGASELKIDKSMLDAAFQDPRGMRLLNGIVDFARSLGMTVCVEGVETADQLELLRSWNVDHVQGYLLAKPMPWSAMRALVESGRSLGKPAAHVDADEAP